MHRVLLATRSTFFEGVCRNGFREAETGIIDLTEDDAEAVEHMVHCMYSGDLYPIQCLIRWIVDFYHLDYLNQSLSRRSSQRSQRSGTSSSSRIIRQSASRKVNFALLEDPLLAQATAANKAIPLTPPAEEATFQSLETSKVHDMPIADQFENDELDNECSESEPVEKAAHLIIHAKVYAIAEKYVPPSSSSLHFAFLLA